MCATLEQRYGSYSRLRLWGIIGFLVAAVVALAGKSIVWGILAVLPLVWAVLFHLEFGKLKREEQRQNSAFVEK